MDKEEKETIEEKLYSIIFNMLFRNVINVDDRWNYCKRLLDINPKNKGAQNFIKHIRFNKLIDCNNILKKYFDGCNVSINSEGEIIIDWEQEINNIKTIPNNETDIIYD